MSFSKVFVFALLAACVCAGHLRQKLARANLVRDGEVKNFTPKTLPCSWQATVFEEDSFEGEVYNNTYEVYVNKANYLFINRGEYSLHHLYRPAANGTYFDHCYELKDDKCSSVMADEGDLEFFIMLYFSEFLEPFQYTNITKDVDFKGQKCDAYSIHHEEYGTTRTVYVKDDLLIGSRLEDEEDYEQDTYTYVMEAPASKFAYDAKFKGCNADAYVVPTSRTCEDVSSSSPVPPAPSSEGSSMVTVTKALFVIALVFAFLF